MSEITLDLVAKYPRPGMAIPGRIAFAPGGTRLTFLESEGGSLRRVLWTYDLATGTRRVLYSPATGVTDENVSQEEALRRERLRLRETGVTEYAWSENGETLLIPLRGELLVQTSSGVRSVATDAVDPHLSFDGSMIAFVRGGELYVVDVAAASERRLTFDAKPGVTNGLAEFVAQEEMGRHSGFWWSRDGKWLAYEQADESGIPLYTIPHLGGDKLEFETAHYPFAGTANVKIKLGVIPAAGGATVWLDIAGFEYLARVDWHPDGRLFVQLQTRDQRKLELRAYDPRTGESTTLLTEESKYWVNLNHDLRFVAETGEFIWASERTGFKHLYLYSAQGDLIRALTKGDWPVDRVSGLDSKGRRLAFTGSRKPTEKHVFTVSLDGGEPAQLTAEPGIHEAIFSQDLSSWVEIFDSFTQPYTVILHGPDRTIAAPAKIDLPLVTPELFELTNRDGVTLHGLLFKPAKLPTPLIVHVYGGPGVQLVNNSWGSTVDLRAQYLVRQGFLVMRVDNRGSARRGLEFEGALAEKMGTVEVRDQIDGVEFARSKGWVQGDGVGIFGWSYGGYMTLMAMLKAPDVFTVGVSGAPVTHWDGYDTHYTERYMRTPLENSEGYRDGSAMAHADKLSGKLLLIHGMLDENVHFRHSARLIESLVKANRSCDLLLFPSERHMPRSEKDRRNMEERVAEYFKTYLK